jgi:long-chain acyl-CoA synthetase
MASVPRFYEKIKAKIEARAEKAGGFTKVVFRWSVAVGSQKTDNWLEGRADSLFLRIKEALAHKLVYRKIHERMGGKLRYLISGGAPLSPNVARFFLSIGLKLLEGYGLTEAAPIISGNTETELKLGTVGKSLASVEVRIAEDGEIIARGPNVMRGYYKMPEETKTVIRDGWLYTGDIGKLDHEGYLVITDRKKQLIVTSVGKKIAPQPIEKEVENSKFIDQVLLIGDNRSFITALIVPDFAELHQYATSAGLDPGDNGALLQAPEIIKLFDRELQRYQRKFSDFERIKKFILLTEAFSVENGLLTPTMKIRRAVVERTYAAAIADLYTA